MDYSWEIIKMIFYLLLVLGFIYLLTKVLKNKFFQPRGGSNMEIIEQLYLSPKESLKLVKVRDRILLLGVTSEKIELLCEWSSAEFGPLPEKKGVGGEDGFSGYLKKFLKQYRRDQHD